MRRPKRISHDVTSDAHTQSSDVFFWIFMFILFAAVLGWFIYAWVAYPYPYDHIHYVNVTAASESQHDAGGVFVFRSDTPHPSRPQLRQHRFARKRTDCKTGEFWDEDVAMCAPRFNSPVAFDSSIMNTSTTACDSFFNSMCGKWNDEHTNEDRTFSYAYHRNQQQVTKIIQKDDVLSAMLTSCINVPYALHHLESKGEFVHQRETIMGNIRSYADLPVVFGRLARQGYTTPFVFSIERHPLQPRMIPFFASDSEFRNFSTPFIYDVYQSTQRLTDYGYIMIADRVRRVEKILAGLREHDTPPVTDFHAYISSGAFAGDLLTYREMPVWHIPHANAAGWIAYFQALDGTALRFAQIQDVWVIGKSYLQWLVAGGLKSFELMDWISYVEFSILYNTHQFVPALPNNVYFRKRDHFGPIDSSTFYHRIPRQNVTGHPLNQAQCVQITQYLLPGLVAEQFLAQIPAKNEMRLRVLAIVQNVLASYKTLILASTWLSQSGKTIAITKLDNIVVRIAEPDDWEPEPFAARISADRYDHNVNMIRRYRVQRNLQQWHKERAERFTAFAMPLTEVNAYYSGPGNSITVLAGILTHPIFSMQYSELSQYAILGSIIGHELAHALDHNGLYWDSSGSYVPQLIWQLADVTKYAQHSQCVIAEYGPAPEGCAASEYGTQTQNEDLADLIGIRLAYSAYFAHHPEASMGDKQYFFMIFAQAWCSTYDSTHKCESVANDEHAIAEYRVDRTLRNIEQFQRAFMCHSGNRMHKPAEEQCIVLD